MSRELALVGVALLLGAPAPRPRPAARSSGRHRPQIEVHASRTLVVVGAVATAALCVAAAGVRVGGAVSLLLVPTACVVLRHVQRRRRPSPVGATLPRALDLAAAALRTGVPVSTALSIAAPVTDPDTAALLDTVAGLLRLGASPAEAWADVAEHPQLGRLARMARLGAPAGVRLAGSWENCAREIRDEMRAAASARATRAGVLAMAPLGVCFLPAFLCLGVVPDALALFGTSWDSLA